RRGVQRRGAAAGIVYVLALAIIVGLVAAFTPTVVDQVGNLVDATPGYVSDLTHGRGSLGFLETKYHVVERVQDAVKGNGSGRIAGGATAALDVTRSVITFVAGVVTIAFMTFFMLLEGRNWIDSFFSLLNPESEMRWRAVGHDIYKTVGGYVSGNLLISLIAGGLTAIVLAIMGVPYAIALGLIVGILDLIPLAGATIAAIIVGAVAFLHSIPAGIVVIVFFIVYQQVENHLIQPVVYGRTVQLSPLAVLISVLIGAELAGVLGALGAIPVAGSLQVIFLDWLRHRRAQPVIEPG
ncbi:MAG TPA: AI-2E family transporter, partial [Casimicrobiaceae bacterium]